MAVEQFRVKKSESDAAPRDDAIELDGLSVLYSDTVALHPLALSVRRGSLFGLIGSAGAGKTTLLRVLATLQRPSSGSARVLDFDVVTGAVGIRSRIGYMPHEFPRCEGLTTREYLDLFSTLHGLDRSRRRHVVSGLLELLDLTDVDNVLVDDLPPARLWRLNLARTLAHEPELLLLDEPSSGIGGPERETLFETLGDLRDMGTTIVVAAEPADCAEVKWSELVILERGRLVQAGLSTFPRGQHQDVADGLASSTSSVQVPDDPPREDES